MTSLIADWMTSQARSRSAVERPAWAVRRRRLMPSGTEGGRKLPTRTPDSRHSAAARTASRGPGIGTETTAPADGVTPQTAARRAAVVWMDSVRAGVRGEDAEGCEGGGAGGGVQAGVEDERTRSIDEMLTEYGRTEDHATLAGKSLRQRHRDDHMVRARKPSRRDRTTPAAGHPQTMCLVDQQHSTMLLRHRRQRRPAVPRRRARCRQTQSARRHAARCARQAPYRPPRRRCAAQPQPANATTDTHPRSMHAHARQTPATSPAHQAP